MKLISITLSIAVLIAAVISFDAHPPKRCPNCPEYSGPRPTRPTQLTEGTLRPSRVQHLAEGGVLRPKRCSKDTTTKKASVRPYTLAFVGGRPKYRIS